MGLAISRGMVPVGWLGIRTENVMFAGEPAVVRNGYPPHLYFSLNQNRKQSSP
jgi:hypothetical protein